MYPLKLSKLISEEQLKTRTLEIAKQISEEFKGEELVAVCILKGSHMFFSDLVRELDLDVSCEFLGLSSYHGSTKSSGEVKITMDIANPLKDKNILVVEDIVDSGITMNYLQTLLKARQPKTIKTVSLLKKPAALKVDVHLDYVGFEIENQFVVGYGLDYQELYRNLPYIAQAENVN